MTDHGKYNLFLPIMFGGLGFPIHSEVKSEIFVTKFQRRFAAYLSAMTDLSLAQGKYPKRYFCALLTDTSPIKSLIRKAGNPEMCRGPIDPPPGWKLFLPRGLVIGGPMSMEHIVNLCPEVEYRLPARSLLKNFNRIQFNLKTGFSGVKEDSFLSRSLSNDELFSPSFAYILVRDALWVGTPTDAPSYLRSL